MWFWLLKSVFLGPAVRWFARPTVHGLDRWPATGPVVVAANHLSEIDSLVLCLVLPRRLRFIAKVEYYSLRTPRGWVSRFLCAATGQIAVDRSGGDAATRSLGAARQLLERGGVWAIYPEGTRSPDGRLHRGHTGVARVALEVPGVTVVPVGLVGTREVDPPGRRGWSRGRVEVRVGDPLDLAAWRRRPDGVRGATDALMAALADLTGQEYVDRYPTSDEVARRDGAA